MKPICKECLIVSICQVRYLEDCELLRDEYSINGNNWEYIKYRRERLSNNKCPLCDGDIISTKCNTCSRTWTV